MYFGGTGQGALYCHKGGKWMPRRTFGDAPRFRYGAGAAVCGDTMYLMCGTSSGPDKDYRVVRQESDVFRMILGRYRVTILF